MGIKQWIESKINQYVRVCRLMKKPSLEEFKSISKVSAIGLLVIGAIGFVINVFVTLVFK
jgi:protein transport protein SEC61 subunit gamma-like protein